MSPSRGFLAGFETAGKFDVRIDDAQRLLLIAALKVLPGYSEDDELLIGMLSSAVPVDASGTLNDFTA